jgi:hypothetical protein
MRILVIAVLLFAGCRDRVATDDDRVGMGKTIEADDDFLHTRAHFESQMRDRLSRLNARINDLGSHASIHLRAQRDQLAMQIEQINRRGEADWDAFRSKLERSFNEVEQGLVRE